MTLSRRVGTLLGGECVTVSGITFQEEDEINCKFGEDMLGGLYISESQAACVTPSTRKESAVEFQVKVQRGALTLTGGALYQYGKLEW